MADHKPFAIDLDDPIDLVTRAKELPLDQIIQILRELSNLHNNINLAGRALAKIAAEKTMDKLTALGTVANEALKDISPEALASMPVASKDN